VLFLNQETIAKLIPHSGKMCLLEKIINWNEQTLRAQSLSHLKKENPLRTEGKLKSIHGIEYAAQAMAVHGALLKQKTQHGYLASIRSIVLHESFLPTQQAPLDIQVSVLMRYTNGFTYHFELLYENQLIISGKITIFLI
jgi:predicted hotdog family 3-hydroxylacyl-ACP dehydratase